MKPVRGMSLMDVIVGAALVVIVFSTLFGLLRASIFLGSLGKDQSTATTIANSQMEYVRSLAYDSVGTVGGIPAGAIPQNSTTTQDGVTYNVRTFIDYYDDPTDGTGASDTNGITTDYKRVKIVVSYTMNTVSRQVTLISNYAPASLETTLGGGTLQITVVDSKNVPVSGATVHIVNASTTPTVDLSTFTNAAGIVYLPGAATSTQYSINVTKSGYSTAQTYARDATNQNPTPGYLTITKNQTTGGTFVIDRLSQVAVNTYSPIVPGAFSDPFNDSTKLAIQTNVQVAGGLLVLAGGAGNYVASGTASSLPVAPSNLASWTLVTATTTVPAGGAIILQVVDATGTPLPDTVIPGNSGGLTTFPMDLSSVSTSTYPSLALKATMTTSSPTNTTPSIDKWEIDYTTGPTPLPNVAYTLTGTKTVGSTGGGAPIYKTIISTSTDSGGLSALTLEWDLFTLTVPSYDVVDACKTPPYSIAPNTSVTELLFLSAPTANRVLVLVADSSGVPVSGASVTLSRSGFTKTVTTSSCGSAYFGSVSSASDYQVSIAKAGYTSNSATAVTISGQTFYEISF
jgi:hypothetical protein